MKSRMNWMWLLMLLAPVAWAQNPLRVAVLEFRDQTGQRSDGKLGGAISPGTMAEKGVFLLGKQLVNKPDFTLIDRRDLLAQMDKLQPSDMGKLTPTKPSFIQAAQLLRADAVLRGSLLALSTGKETVNLGGNRSEFTKLTVRVGLEALDAKDGAVIAAIDGRAERSFRQTEALSTELSEDDILQLVEDAIGNAIPGLDKALAQRSEQARSRPMVKVSIKTQADPALIEIDGVLVGASPIENFEVYKGDHVLNISKPGFQEINKRILFERDMSIESPMFHDKMSADEVKSILEKSNIHTFIGDPGLIINTIEEGAKK